MANIYVRSTDGSDSDNGSTWALAKATLTGAAAIDAAGDTIWLSQVHSETSASALTFNLAGTPANPVRVLCGNDAAAPPTALTTGATITATTGTSSQITISGDCYVKNVKFSFTGNMAMGATAGNWQVFDGCVWEVNTTASSGFIQQLTTTGIGKLRLIDPSIKFAGAANYIFATNAFEVSGGSLASGTTTPTAGMFRIGSSGRGEYLLVEGFDFSNASSSLVLFNAGSSLQGAVTFRGCKMPTSWSDANLTGGSIGGPGLRVEMYACAAGAVNYDLRIASYYGTIVDETTLVVTGGPSPDGTTTLSYKMSSNANANYPTGALTSQEFAIPNETTGSAKTLTVEVLHDSVTALTDADIWVEVLYPSSSGSPIMTRVSDATADVLTTPAAQTTSTATWTTTGMTNPNTQKLSVTFTPQMVGPIVGRVFLAKPSKTVYVSFPLALT